MTDFSQTPALPRRAARAMGGVLLIGLAAALGGCTSGKTTLDADIAPPPAPTAPATTGTPVTPPLAETDSGAVSAQTDAPSSGGDGVKVYDGYSTVVARQGDTVQSVASRAGISADQLAAYNGLSPAASLQPGDELVIPPT